MEELKVSQQLGVISTNLDSIKADLEKYLEDYKDYTVTQDSITADKKVLADLRKLRTSLEDARKQTKKEWEKPYKEFEAKYKDVLALVDEPIDLINQQLKLFDEARAAEKLEHCKALYAENIGEYTEYIPFESVFNDKWLNATTKDKDIQYDLSEAITKVKSDIYVIEALGSEITDELIATYKKTGNDLKAVIQKNNDYNAAKKLAEEKVKEEIAEKAEKAPAEEEKSVELPKTETKEEDVIYFKVTGAESITMVRDFCGLNGINVEEIPG